METYSHVPMVVTVRHESRSTVTKAPQFSIPQLLLRQSVFLLYEQRKLAGPINSLGANLSFNQA